MRQLITGIAAVVVISQVLVAAQTEPKASSSMKDGMLTVTGCVTAGKGAGEYMLSRAMMAGTMPSDKTKEPAGATGGHMMSYELMGGDLKMQMGHQVEIMGMLDKTMMKTMAAMSEKEKMDKMASMTTPMKLEVKSVKMIASTCS